MTEPKPGHLTMALKPAKAHYQWDPEFIERVLYEIAANGGNCAGTHRQLVALNEERDAAGEEQLRLPSVRTLRYWIQGPFRNRYHEITVASARQLEELIASQGVENAIAMGKAEQDALKQTMAGLANANGVEASQILRNISMAKATSIEKSLLLRGRPTVITAETPLEQIARELQQMGIVEVIDSTAEEVVEG
jgi:hypothetical protein